MTCKECIHYDVCKIIHFPSLFGLTGDACDHFKPKSRFVELPCEAGDEVWVIDREDGEAVDISCIQFLAKSKGIIIGTAWINDYDIDETIEYHICETQENFDTDLKVYPIEDCFVTRKEAEKALEERIKK